MRTLTHLKRRGDNFFHLDSHHLAFFFIASVVLAALIVLVLVPSAR